MATARYVVAGATGQVGSAVAEELLARGERVRLVVRDPERATRWAERGAEIVAGSLGDTTFLSTALRDAGGFFTLLPEDRATQDFHGDRRRLADSIATAIQSSAVPQVVMISSLGARFASGNGPGADLHYLESAIRVTGVPFRALRGCYFQENVAGMLPLAEHEGIYPCLFASPDVAIPTVSAREAGRVAARLLTQASQGSEIIDLVGPAYSARQFAEALGSAIGKPVRVVEVPPEARVPALMQAGFSRSFAEAVAEMLGARPAGSPGPSADRLERATTTLQETLRGALAGRAV